MNIGDKIRQLRIKNNVSQNEMAKYLNVTSATYSRYETGNIKVDIDIIVKIAKVFNVSLNYFFDCDCSNLENNKVINNIIKDFMEIGIDINNFEMRSKVLKFIFWNKELFTSNSKNLTLNN